ncbi:hypothetical protein NDU88_003943 [Pleurodeles waltl]|uniref:Uncharacterized protein n=1 Tax=Pleurodeles waltl TaxID=8319 RepID=A0AAV7VHC3_PLEWA|nr:hypothetical protein NDU88_003943 [Pleurodeles waltl]
MWEHRHLVEHARNCAKVATDGRSQFVTREPHCHRFLARLATTGVAQDSSSPFDCKASKRLVKATTGLLTYLVNAQQ